MSKRISLPIGYSLSVRCLSLLLLIACGDEKRPAQKVVPGAPAGAQSVVGKSGPIELLASDGAAMNPFTLTEYAKEFAGNTSIVFAKQFPAKASPLAGAGVNMFAQGKNVSWMIDGQPKVGFVFVYDENANGSLADDPVHELAKVGENWETTVTMQMPGMFSEDTIPAPARIRFTGKGARVQRTHARKGTLPLSKASMQFALIGDGGQFGLDHHYIAFDLNRDGTLDLESLDNPELFGVFEKAITIDDVSYAFELTPDGGQLGLRPLKDKLPTRAPLSAGTPAPDIAVTDLDGKPASLGALRGKIVLIDFWATSCAPCVKALPRLKALHAKYAPKGFELLAIAMPSDDVKDVLGTNRAGISAIDEPAQLTYRVDRFPMQYLVGRDGNILCSRCQLDKVETLLAEQLK